jgi:hypothetical protein
MTPRGLRPEVLKRLRELSDAEIPTDTRPIGDVIAAYMAGTRDDETRALARQVLAEHKEFFEMIGER